MRFLFNPKSSNTKVGPIPVVMASKDTCPTTCGLKGNGCYAESGPLAIWWNRLSKGEIKSLSFPELIAKIRQLPPEQLWRYGQAGDLPPEKDDILTLARANEGREAIVYTHGRDFGTYKEATKLGFHINLSADSIEDADNLIEYGLSITAVIPSKYSRGKNESISEFRKRLGGRISFESPGGNKIVVCPATYADDVSCASCRICATPRKSNAIVGFPAHGTSKKRIDNVLERRREGIVPQRVDK